MKNGNKLIVLFSMLLLVLSFMPTAVVAEDVAVWTEWIVNGQGVPTYTMDAEKGETVNFYVYAESFHSFELDIYLEDQNNDEISNFNDDPVDGYTNFFKEYSYVANQVGTFYIHPVAKIGSFVNEDEIKLVVTCQDTDGDDVCDVDEVLGCTNNTATNYNSAATEDDGSCTYPAPADNNVPYFTLDPLADSSFLLIFPVYELTQGDWKLINVIGHDEDGDDLHFEFSDANGGTIPTGIIPIDLGENNNNAQILILGAPLGNHGINIKVIDEHGANVTWPVIFDVSCSDTDNDGVCDVDEVAGCTDITAENFDPLATDDDGSCTFACVDTDNDGVCDVDEVAGCTDITAENFDPLATDDDGSCTFACVDTDNDGVCDVDEVAGCTDITAENFDPLATDDDGSCTYNGEPSLGISGKTTIYEGEELNLGITVMDESVGIFSLEVYQEKCLLFICIDGDLPEGAAINPASRTNGSFTWTPNHTFVTHPDGSKEITFIFKVSDGEYDVEKEVVVTVLDRNQLPELSVETNEPFAENKDVSIIVTGTDADKDYLRFAVNGVPGWAELDFGKNRFVVSGTPDCESSGDFTLTVIVTDGLDSVTEVLTFNVAEACDVPCSDVDGDGVCDVDEVAGCTDVTAENYNPLATDDDGSCTYVCVDTDADGVCDVDEVAGCTDITAENYNPLATDDNGSCTYACEDLDQDGICDFEDDCVDQDNDGICDQFDQCVLEAEDFDNYLDNDGCPDSHEDAKISSVHLSSETLTPGDYLVLYLTMSNNGDTSFDYLEAKAVVYGWGTKVVAGEFDLSPGQEKGRQLVMQVPYYTQPGDYLIKVTVGNDYYHEQTYRLVTIY